MFCRYIAGLRKSCQLHHRSFLLLKTSYIRPIWIYWFLVVWPRWVHKLTTFDPITESGPGNGILQCSGRLSFSLFNTLNFQMLYLVYGFSRTLSPQIVPRYTSRSLPLQTTINPAFFPRTIIHWNALPTCIVLLPTLAQFSHAVCQVVHVSP